MTRQVVPTPELSTSPGYSHVVRAGDLVVVSGQVARDVDGRLVGAGNVGVQARQVFDNLRAALGAAGVAFDDVVKLTVFVTNLADRAAVSAVRDEAFAQPRPASTFLVVASLAAPEFLVEVEALAYVLPPG